MDKIKFLKLKCQLRTLNILFFSSELICQAARKTAKRSESNWNEANIESALNICSEGKSICATAKPCGMSEATFEIDSKSKKRERHCWDLEEKSPFENKKENNWQIILKLCKQCNVGFSHSLKKIKEIVR